MTAAILRATGQHVILVAIAVGVAIAAGIPIGIWCARRAAAGRSVMRIIDIIQTIPSLALFGLLIPLPFIGGIGPRTAIVALILYSLLPIVRNTVTGIRGVDAGVREAAVAMGFTPHQLLVKVELPLAMPTIIAGIRIATVIGIGVATIAAAIGGGGLGDLIFRGVAMVDTRLILAGAIPAAALAIVADVVLTVVEKRLTPFIVHPSSFIIPFILLLACHHPASVVVGSKNFTESVLLGEIVAQKLESAGCRVDRRLNLGGTLVCDSALASGSLDVYVEYSGTALTAILHQPLLQSRDAVNAAVTNAYAKRGLHWGPNLGFNDTFAMIVRGDSGMRTISDLHAVDDRFQPAFGYEFVERPDGWPGLLKHYGLHFAKPPKTMDLGLTYKALASGQADLIAGNSTDGLIQSLGLKVLDDDRHYFPPYDAAVVYRNGMPCAAALESLAGTIDDATMRRLNYEVDGKHRPVEAVAREFLRRRTAVATLRNDASTR